MLVGLSVEIVTESRPRRFEKKVVVGELRERDPFPVGQGVVSGRDDEKVFFEQLLCLDVGIANGEGKYGEVELATVHLGE